MASQIIRSLINNQVDSPLSQARIKIKEEGKRKIDTLKDKLPTVKDLQDKFTSNACSLESQEKMTKQFENMKNKINSILGAAENAIKSLNSIKEKLEKILNVILKKIESFVEIFNPILLALKIIIKIIPTVLSSIPTAVPGMTAGIPFRLSKLIESANEKLGEYVPLLASIPLILPILKNKVNKILSPLQLIINAINKFISFVKEKMAFLEFLFLFYLQKCNVADLDDNTGGGSGGNNNIELNQDLSKIRAELQEMYGNLLNNMTNVKIIERIKNIEFGFQTGYRVINKPLSEIL